MENMNDRVVEQLRQLADFYELHGDIPAPFVSLGCWLNGKDEALRVAKLPGARKEYSETSLDITVPVAKELSVVYWIAHDYVCTAKRTEIVTEPARPEYTYEKVVEWECHPLLAPDTEELPWPDVVVEACCRW